MASDDTYDDEFQLVNEFENLTNDEVVDKNRKNSNGNGNGNDDIGEDGEMQDVNEEDANEDEEDMINISKMNALKKKKN